MSKVVFKGLLKHSLGPPWHAAPTPGAPNQKQTDGQALRRSRKPLSQASSRSKGSDCNKHVESGQSPSMLKHHSRQKPGNNPQMTETLGLCRSVRFCSTPPPKSQRIAMRQKQGSRTPKKVGGVKVQNLLFLPTFSST